MRGSVTEVERVPALTRLAPVQGAGMRRHLVGCAVSRERLARRVRQLAEQLASDYAGSEVVVVGLLNGSVPFVADLIRQWPGPLNLDFIGVSSYRGGRRSGRLEYTKKLRLDVRGRDVLVVDDILDSGRTLTAVRRRLRRLGAASVRACVLLDKPARREVAAEAEYVGFVIPDWFVVGYGLDFQERWRNLPFIGVLRPEEASRPEP